MDGDEGQQRAATNPSPAHPTLDSSKSYTRHFLSDALGARWRRTPSAPQHRRVPAARNHCSHQPSRPSAANHTHCSRSDRWLKVHRAGPNKNRARFTQQLCSAGTMRESGHCVSKRAHHPGSDKAAKCACVRRILQDEREFSLSSLSLSLARWATY